MTMANPIDTFKKIKSRSWSELRTRGGQVFSAYSEQIGLSGKLPSDDELAGLLVLDHFGGKKPSADDLHKKFHENAAKSFFKSTANLENTTERFKNYFGDESFSRIIEQAHKISEGRFDLLGYKNLRFGDPIDWHFEPVSGKHIQIRHWKQYDELDAAETGDKKIVWELNRHQHFFTLGTAYWLTSDEDYALAFVNHLESWMEQNPPGLGINWMSSLEVSFRAISWFWAFNLFRSSRLVTPELFKKALKYFHIHGRHLEKYLSTYYSPNTHLTGEALGLYYLGTQLPFLSRAAQWRKLGSEILLGELDRQVLPDGVYFEQSTWYQRYTIDFYTQFFILKQISGEQADPASEEKLKDKLQQMLDFLMYTIRPDGTTPLIGDDDGGRALPLGGNRPDDFRDGLSTGAVIYAREDYKFVAQKPAEETFWLLDDEGINKFTELDSRRPEHSSIAFRDGGYFIMRDGWAETDSYLLIDCGNLGGLSGGHSHADTLGVDLAIGGQTMLVDPGTYSYHESEDLRNYFRSTTAHNTLDINHKSSSESGSKFSWNKTAKAKLNSWIAQDRFDFFEGSHDGYQGMRYPAIHTRSILGIKNDYWIIRDHVDSLSRNDVRLNFHFDAKTNPLIISSNAKDEAVDEHTKNIGLRLMTFGDKGQWDRKESWVSKCYGEKINAPYLTYTSSQTGPQEFFTFMFPLEAGFEKPQVFETPLAGGRAFVIKYRDYDDIFVFTDGDGQIVRTEFFDSDFRFLWARLSEGEDFPEEFVLVNGTTFFSKGREVIGGHGKLEYAIARRLGTDLNVRTNQEIFSLSLPQKEPSPNATGDSESGD